MPYNADGSFTPAASAPSGWFDSLKEFAGGDGAKALGAVVGGIAGLTGGSTANQPSGYQGGIPDYQATRDVVPNVNPVDRRPGSSGQRYFTDVQYEVDPNNPYVGYSADEWAARNAAAIPEEENSLLNDWLAQYQPANQSTGTDTTTSDYTGIGTNPDDLTGLSGGERYVLDTQDGWVDGGNGTITDPTGVIYDTENGGAQLSESGLSASEQQLIQQDGWADNLDGTVTAPNGLVYDTDNGGVVSDTGLSATEQLLVANHGYTTNEDGTVSSPYGQVRDVAVNETTPTDSVIEPDPIPVQTSALSPEEQYLVDNNGWVDRGDGTLTASDGRVYDSDAGFSTAPTTVSPSLPEYLAPFVQPETEYNLPPADGDYSAPEATQVADMIRSGEMSLDAAALLYGVTPEYIQENMQYFAGGGMYLGGPTDGMADLIPANRGTDQEARLSDGEFVVSADVVSGLGNGNSNAGAEILEEMMGSVRKARTGTETQGKQIDPNQFIPV